MTDAKQIAEVKAAMELQNDKRVGRLCSAAEAGKSVCGKSICSDKVNGKSSWFRVRVAQGGKVALSAAAAQSVRASKKAAALQIKALAAAAKNPSDPKLQAALKQAHDLKQAAVKHAATIAKQQVSSPYPRVLLHILFLNLNSIRRPRWPRSAMRARSSTRP